MKRCYIVMTAAEVEKCLKDKAYVPTCTCSECGHPIQSHGTLCENCKAVPFTEEEMDAADRDDEEETT